VQADDPGLQHDRLEGCADRRPESHTSDKQTSSMPRRQLKNDPSAIYSNWQRRSRLAAQTSRRLRSAWRTGSRCHNWEGRALRRPFLFLVLALLLAPGLAAAQASQARIGIIYMYKGRIATSGSSGCEEERQAWSIPRSSQGLGAYRRTPRITAHACRTSEQRERAARRDPRLRR